jgi:hypothetical protein
MVKNAMRKKPVVHLPTVYVAQQPTPKLGTGWIPDLSPANKFGKVEFVFDAPDKPWVDTQNAIAKILVRTKEFDADTDFLLWPQSGDPASFWLMIQTLTARGFHRLRFLYYQREGFYIPILGDVSQVAECIIA